MKKMNKKGFSLLEFLVYLAICSIVSLVLSQWVVTLIKDRNNIRLKNSTKLSLLSSMDCFTRDIYEAPSEQSAWQDMQKDLLSWKKGTKKIKYSYIKNSIYRIVKNNSLLLSHQKASKQIILDNVIDCIFSLKKQDERVIVATIALTIQKGGCKCEQKRTAYIQSQ